MCSEIHKQHHNIIRDSSLENHHCTPLNNTNKKTNTHKPLGGCTWWRHFPSYGDFRSTLEKLEEKEFNKSI